MTNCDFIRRWFLRNLCRILKGTPLKKWVRVTWKSLTWINVIQNLGHWLFLVRQIPKQPLELQNLAFVCRNVLYVMVSGVTHWVPSTNSLDIIFIWSLQMVCIAYKFNCLMFSISFSIRNTLTESQKQPNKIKFSIPCVLSRPTMGDTAYQLIVTCICIKMSIFYSFNGWYQHYRKKAVVKIQQL